ncbi:alpha/beta fold hydrolase [Nocardia sp. NPDC050630]|uniref:alpha/beta fold hydrolase n=1 Tax=Nocardia sp. NPDC050630 TaxID=3364321 RepID=UPI0037964CEF
MAVILLHSLALDSRSWDGVLPGIAELGPLTVDLPGHGEALSAPFELDRAVERVLDAITGHLPCHEGVPKSPAIHVVGCGIGALIADRVSRRIHVDTLTLMSWPPDQRPGQLAARADTARQALSADEVGFLREYRSGITTCRSAPPAPVSAASFVAALRAAAVWRPQRRPDATAVRIVRGRADERTSAVDARRLAARWDARYIEVGDAGHACYVDQPDRLATLIRDLDDGDGYPPTTLSTLAPPAEGES